MRLDFKKKMKYANILTNEGESLEISITHLALIPYMKLKGWVTNHISRLGFSPGG